MGQSLYNVGRKLTAEELGELKSWCAANPELRWRRGDTREDGLRFWRIGRNSCNGEHWVTSEKFESWRSKAREAKTKARAADPERGRAAAREWRAKNLEKVRERDRKAKARCRDKIREYERIRAKTNPLVAMAGRVRRRTARAFRDLGYNKTSKTAEILGCSWGELVLHIESRFTAGMTWENRGLWHLDHIVPLSSAKTEEEILALCHYTNLQPLWASENFRKSNKMPHELLG